MKITKNFIIPALVAIFCLTSAHAVPVSVDFTRVTNNNTEDLSGQLNLSIYDATDGNAAFGLGLAANQFVIAISNAVGIASSIAEFYIDDNVAGLLTFVSVENSLAGFTDFSGPGASPSNLPSGSTVGFNASTGLSADVNPGNPNRGVDSGLDILGVVYQSTSSLADIENAILAGDLVFGLHIRSIGQAGGSDSYYSMGTPPVDVSEPSILILFGLGLGLLGFARRR